MYTPKNIIEQKTREKYKIKTSLKKHLRTVFFVENVYLNSAKYFKPNDPPTNIT